MPQIVTDVVEQKTVGVTNDVAQSQLGRLETTPEFRRRLKQLSQLSTFRGLSAIAVDWAVIAACFVIALSFPATSFSQHRRVDPMRRRDRQPPACVADHHARCFASSCVTQPKVE